MNKIAYIASLCLVLSSCGGPEEKKDVHTQSQEQTQVKAAEVGTKAVQNDQTQTVKNDDGPVKKAFAVVQAKSDSEVVGAVDFIVVDNGLRVVANIGGLEPGKHGFHIHEHGDCSAHDGTSAGGHFNPFGKKHGGPNSAERHEGDLGNLEADQYGFAYYDEVIEGLKLNGEYSIIGKSIVIHAGEDDLTTDPTGNSGARIGCGAIVDGEID